MAHWSVFANKDDPEEEERRNEKTLAKVVDHQHPRNVEVEG